ncbi:MAG TPA: ion channel [Methanobacterium sp.]|nr:ion channel [Methanobacterium sp.]
MKFHRNRPGYLWQAIIVFLVLLDSIVLLLSIISNLRHVTLEYASVFDLFVSIVLLILLCIALYKSDDKKRYIRRNWPLVFAVIPFLLIGMVTGLLDTYILIFKLLNLIKIISLYLFANKFAKEVIKYQEQTRLVYALAIFILVLFICSFIFYGAEHNVNPEVANYEDSLWFVLQTITTVGYGDIIPVTGVGRVMGVISMLSALALTSIITSVATFSLIEKFRKGTEELTTRTKEQVDTLEEKMDDIHKDLNDIREDNISKIGEEVKELRADLNEIKELLKKK